MFVIHLSVVTVSICPDKTRGLDWYSINYSIYLGVFVTLVHLSH
jgi:hypothetical protein